MQNREQRKGEKEVQMWVNRYKQGWRAIRWNCVCTGANLGNLGAVLAGSRSVRNSQRQAVHSPTQSRRQSVVRRLGRKLGEKWINERDVEEKEVM